MGKVGGKGSVQLAVKPVEGYPFFTATSLLENVLDIIFTQLTQLIHGLLRFLSNDLYTAKNNRPTDVFFFPSPLSTIPITTTTTYI